MKTMQAACTSPPWLPLQGGWHRQPLPWAKERDSRRSTRNTTEGSGARAVPAEPSLPGKPQQERAVQPVQTRPSPLPTAGSRVCQRANTAGAWLGAVLRHTHRMHCEQGSRTLCRAQAAHAGEPDPTPDPRSRSSRDVEEGEEERVSRGGGGGCRGEKACAE